MIYAIRAIGTEYIKFGKANHIGKRLQGLEVGCPHELEVLAAVDWNDETEGMVHWALEQHHHKGEWYKDSERTQIVIQLMNDNDLGGIKELVAKDAKRKKGEDTSAQPSSLACAREGWKMKEYEEAAIAAWYAALSSRSAAIPEKP